MVCLRLIRVQRIAISNSESCDPLTRVVTRPNPPALTAVIFDGSVRSIPVGRPVIIPIRVHAVAVGCDALFVAASRSSREGLAGDSA
jgi:hypothetical protein